MSVTYYTGTGQSAFTTAATVGLPVWEDVIPEIGGKIVFRQDHMIRAVSFERLAISTTYTAHGSYGVPTSSSYFLVGEDGFRDDKGGMIRWSRVWSAVPTTWVDVSEYAYTYPGYSAPISIGTRALVGVPTEYPTYYTIPYTSTISTSDMVYIDGAYSRSSVSYRVNLFTTVEQPINPGVYFSIRKILPGVGTFPDGGLYVRTAANGRFQPETIVVASRVQHDYAKAASQSELDDAIPLVDPFTPVDTIGNSVSYLSTGTATAPNSAEYLISIKNDAQLIAECVRERFIGNIYVRKIRLVPAR